MSPEQLQASARTNWSSPPASITGKKRRRDSLEESDVDFPPAKRQCLDMARRANISSRTQKEAPGKQEKVAANTGSLPSPSPSLSPSPTSPCQSADSSSGSETSSNASSAPPSPDRAARKPGTIFLDELKSWGRRARRGSSVLVNVPGEHRPVPYTKDRCTGVVRKRRMMDDLTDGFSDEQLARYKENRRR